MRKGLFFCAFIACLIPPILPAQSVSFRNPGGGILIGDLDVLGDQLTVEALIYIDVNASFNVVSKHTRPENVNYLLRPQSFEITTYQNGNSGPTQFMALRNPFTFKLKQWYHIAGTYDGARMRYYVNGCLVAEVPFSGQLVQNDLDAAIGNQSNCRCEPFFGRIDEVRIWQTARTAEEIAVHLSSLTDAPDKAGLVANYPFNNSFQNAQGNTDFDGTPFGSVLFAGLDTDLRIFSITDLLIQNSDCLASANGQVTVSSNDVDAAFSLNEGVFQTLNSFAGLATGDYQLTARSPQGCTVDTIFPIGNNHYFDTLRFSPTLCDGDQFLGYSQSGLYTDTLAAQSGCDTLRIIDLTILPNLTNTIQQTICQGDTFEGYQTSGVYVDTFTVQNGCDSIRTLELNVVPPVTSTIQASICSGEALEGYNQNGIFLDTLTGIKGCDSIRTLELTVVPPQRSTIQVTICAGEQFEGYFQSGSYQDTLISANGCDSIRMLELIVVPPKTSIIQTTVCSGESFEGYNQSGIYTDTLTASNGCDSIRTLELVVLPLIHSQEEQSICPGASWEGYTVSGVYIDTFTAQNGCDSIRRLELTVYPVATSRIQTTICPGEAFAGYSETGIYVDTLVSSAGCDSIRTIALIIAPEYTEERQVNLCPGSTYNFNGQNITTAGSFVDTLTTINGCDSIIQLSVQLLETTNHFLGADVQLCGQRQYLLQSPFPATEWSDGTIGPRTTVQETGEYWAVVTDDNGCTAADTIGVQLNGNVYLPTAFSPNGDGTNDTFFPFITDLDIEGFEFRIFDRWGSLVFQSKALERGWDGTSDRAECRSGIYFYLIHFKSPACGEVVLRGDVSLLR